MLTARPKGIFSSDFHIERNGVQVAYLDLNLFGKRGTIEVGSETLRLETSGVMRPEFTLYLDETPLATAKKPSMMKEGMVLRLGDATCEIKRKSLFTRRFVVTSGDQQIGEIRPVHWYSQKAQIDLPGDWPLGLQVFVFWLVVRVWKSNAAASSGT